MDGLIGDILKTIIAVLLIVTLLTILIFFYRLQAVGHYQHAVNGILQENSNVISTQDQFNGTSSTARRLHKLDNDYDWMFVVKPCTDKKECKISNAEAKSNHGYEYGQRIYYNINMNLPLLNHYSINSYDFNSGNLEPNKGTRIYNNNLDEQTTCEKNIDKDVN